jgi:predicted site-specific integrase-resolvase
MKAKQVLQLLKITRPTLTKYIKLGKLKVIPLPNNFYDYDDDSVYALMNKDAVKKNVVYARVSTSEQMNEISIQIDKIRDYCSKHEIEINDVFSDVSSGSSLDRRGLKEMMDEIIQHKVGKVFVFSKDRLTYNAFEFLVEMFSKYECEIVCVNADLKQKIVEKEVFQELIPIVEYFAENVYSSRRKQQLGHIVEDLKLERDI